jgi:hypothetical protein
VGTGKELLNRPWRLSGMPDRPNDPRKEDEGGSLFRSAAFTADGKTAALATGKAVYLVDVTSGKELRKVDGLESVGRIALSPDGKTLAAGVGVFDKALLLWDAATGRELHRIEKIDYVSAVTFSPDGHYVAAASGWRGASTIYLWETATRIEVLRLRGHGTFVNALAFSPEGTRLASALRDGTALVWDLAPQPDRTGPAKDPAGLWTDLAGNDAARTHRAVCLLTRAGERAVAFLKDRLRPAPELDRKRLERLFADLDSKDFTTREAASDELAKLGEQAEPAIRGLLAKKPSPEVCKRLEAIRGIRHPEVSRQVRAVQVLERIGTKEARQVLKALAKGAPAAPLTREAAASLERLARRRGTP